MQALRSYNKPKVKSKASAVIHLPARAVHSLEAGADLLHGLVACQCAQGRHKGLIMHQLPQLLCAHGCQRVLDLQAALQALHVLLQKTGSPLLSTSSAQ